MTRPRLRPLGLLAVLGLVLTLAACGGGDLGTSVSTATSTPRPSSPAQVTITTPVSGAVMPIGKVHIAVTVSGATIVQQTTTDVRPDQGHVHLFLDGALTYMSYTLQEDLPVDHPGNYTLRAEFVASDHVPFNPRVSSQTIIFTVR